MTTQNAKCARAGDNGNRKKPDPTYETGWHVSPVAVLIKATTDRKLDKLHKDTIDKMVKIMHSNIVKFLLDVGKID